MDVNSQKTQSGRQTTWTVESEVPQNKPREARDGQAVLLQRFKSRSGLEGQQSIQDRLESAHGGDVERRYAVLN